MIQLLSDGALSQFNKRAKLPLELWKQVFKHLDEANRVCFALACKENASIFVAARQWFKAEHDKLRSAAGKKTKSVNKASRLKVLVGLREWIGNDYRLCYRCVKYVPFAKHPRRLAGPFDGTLSIETSGLATDKAIREGPRCLACAEATKIQFHHGTRDDLLKLRNLAKSL